MGKIKIAEIPINAINFTDAQDGILSHLIEENGSLKAKNKDFQRRQENLVRDLKKSKQMLVEMEKDKGDIYKIIQISEVFVRWKNLLNGSEITTQKNRIKRIPLSDMMDLILPSDIFLNIFKKNKFLAGPKNVLL